jgi:hypothetical protein
LVSGLRVVVEADGLQQSLEGEDVLRVLVADCEDIEDLLGGRVPSDLVLVLPADHLVEWRFGGGQDGSGGEAATCQRQYLSEPHVIISGWCGCGGNL